MRSPIRLLMILTALGATLASAQTPIAKNTSLNSGGDYSTAASDRTQSTVGESAVGPTEEAGVDRSELGLASVAWLRIHSPLIGTMAGTGVGGFAGDDGPATGAEFRQPYSAAVDGANNVYILDHDNSHVRKIDAATGEITSIAGRFVGTNPDGFDPDGGPALGTRLWNPESVAVDASGNVYIADTRNNRVRKINASTGIITTILGTGANGYSGEGGKGTATALQEPEGVYVDRRGDVYVAAFRFNRILKVDGKTGVVSNFAGNGVKGFDGDGAATAKRLNFPNAVWADETSDEIYIADTDNHRIRRVDNAGNMTTLAGIGGGFAGDGGPANGARMNKPDGGFIDAAKNLYIADTNNARIRKIDPGANGTIEGTDIIETIAGVNCCGADGDGGAAAAAQMDKPLEIAMDNRGHIIVPDRARHRVRRVTWEAEPFAGGGTDGRVLATAVLEPTVDIVVQVDDIDETGNSLSAEVRNAATDEVETVSLTEGAAGVFTGTLPTVAGGSTGDGDDVLGVSPGDPVNIWYTDAAAESRAWSADLLVSASVVSQFGDVDGNGTREIEDVIAMLDHIIGVGAPIQGVDLLRANVSALGIFDGFEPQMADAIVLLQLLNNDITQLPVLDSGSANFPPHAGFSPKPVAPALADREVALEIQGDRVRVWVSDRAGVVSGDVRLSGVKGRAALRPDMEGYVHSASATDGGMRAVFVGSGAVTGPGTILEFRVPAAEAERAQLAEVVLNLGAPAAIGETVILPTEYSLAGNYPNPFNPTTSIPFGIPEAGRIKLEIFDVLGQKVRTLAEGDWPTGFHQVEWDGRDQAGRAAASGLYFYRLQVEPAGGAVAFVKARRMLLIK